MHSTHPPLGHAEAAGEGPFNEASLRAEIRFWRELIEAAGPAQPAASVERMQQALALAEAKLRTMLEARSDAG